MATVNGPTSAIAPGTLRTVWTPLTAANPVGTALRAANWPMKEVLVQGTFDGATVVIEGSDDGTTWTTLQDDEGSPLSSNAAYAEAIIPATVQYIRPNSSGGGGSQSVTVIIMSNAGRF
jgi:hypothetical protein